MPQFFAKPIRRKHNAATNVFADCAKIHLENTGQTVAKLTDSTGYEIVLNPGDIYELDSGFPTVVLQDILSLSFIADNGKPSQLTEEKLYVTEGLAIA